MELNHVLGEQLASLMHKHHIDDAELSKATGIPASTISRMPLNSNANPTAASLRPIARFFNISISQLLGDEPLSKKDNFLDEDMNAVPTHKSMSLIEIEKEVLKYILHKCIVLFPPMKEADEVINYIVDVIYDASHLETDRKTILKIIDMMLSSATRFNNINKERA